jgi:hypothetical protein
MYVLYCDVFSAVLCFVLLCCAVLCFVLLCCAVLLFVVLLDIVLAATVLEWIAVMEYWR